MVQDLYGFSYLNSCKKEVVHLGATCMLKFVEILHIQRDRRPLKDVSNQYVWPLLLTAQPSLGQGNFGFIVNEIEDLSKHPAIKDSTLAQCPLGARTEKKLMLREGSLCREVALGQSSLSSHFNHAKRGKWGNVLVYKDSNEYSIEKASSPRRICATATGSHGCRTLAACSTRRNGPEIWNSDSVGMILCKEAIGWIEPSQGLQGKLPRPK